MHSAITAAAREHAGATKPKAVGACGEVEVGSRGLVVVGDEWGMSGGGCGGGGGGGGWGGGGGPEESGHSWSHEHGELGELVALDRLVDAADEDERAEEADGAWLGVGVRVRARVRVGG